MGTTPLPHRAPILVFTLLASFAFPTQGKAWGDLGHKVICGMALQLVQPTTRVAIDRLTALDGRYATFADSCVFPDHPRIRSDEHFVNLPRDSKGLDHDNCPEADKCVVTAILDDSRILADKSQSDAVRAEALMSLGHWVGDIHQPLHVSFADDRGGNTIKVTGECSGNLHSVWDTCLVLYALGPDEADAQRDLLAHLTPERQREWSGGGPKDWANESFKIAESPRTQYCVLDDGSCHPGSGEVVVGDQYLSENERVVTEQIQKAAVRLATLLDTLLGSR
jgi:hypothetical protein